MLYIYISSFLMCFFNYYLRLTPHCMPEFLSIQSLALKFISYKYWIITLSHLILLRPITLVTVLYFVKLWPPISLKIVIFWFSPVFVYFFLIFHPCTACLGHIHTPPSLQLQWCSVLSMFVKVLCTHSSSFYWEAVTAMVKSKGHCLDVIYHTSVTLV